MHQKSDSFNATMTKDVLETFVAKTSSHLSSFTLKSHVSHPYQSIDLTKT